MKMIIPIETNCTTLFSQSHNSCFSNYFPSNDENVRTEGLLSEPLPFSFGDLQGCVMVLRTPWPSSNIAIISGISPQSDLMSLMQSVNCLRTRVLQDLQEKNILTICVRFL